MKKVEQQTYLVKRGDIVYINIPKDENDPHKQCGIRPCVVMSNDSNNKYCSRIMYIPLTTKNKKKLPTHIVMTSTDCLERESIALCECLDTINQKFILYKIGRISEDDMIKIEMGKDIQLSDNNRIKFLIKNLNEYCYA